MPKSPRRVTPDLVEQEIEKGRIGDQDLAQKPGHEPAPGLSEEGEDIVWDDDQRQLIENQDMSEIERARQRRPDRG